ncbi:16S rRNA (cytidine(1402)-2'-O)-methyltransferase [Oscillospiraceae bacterium LCP25S3_E3]
MSGILYVVGTPIGNLGDMSPRAVETLENVDFIAAEDTRVTLKLLNHFGIKKPMVSYFEHNKHQRGEIICQRILSGENCAIVTDAGMPCISDPGELLVKQCEEYGIEVKAVPGPSAVISALAISGLPTGRFTFEGFLSVNKKSRMEHLESVKNETRTMIFYEAPHKLNATLRDMLGAFGNRSIAIVRELTKIHEEVIRTTLEQAVERYSEAPLKGEIVLVIDGAKPVDNDKVYTEKEAVDLAIALAAGEDISLSEASKKAAKETGIKKGIIYKLATERDEVK